MIYLDVEIGKGMEFIILTRIFKDIIIGENSEIIQEGIITLLPL